MSTGGTSKRLPGLRNINNNPNVIFTLEDHPKSRKLLTALPGRLDILLNRLGQKILEDCRPEFLCFSTLESLSAYHADRGLTPEGVLLWDCPLKKKRIAPLLFEEGSMEYPFRSVAMWGVRVNSDHPEEEIPSTATQILYYFCVNFMRQIDKGQLPWGPVKQPWNRCPSPIGQTVRRWMIRDQYLNGPPVRI